MRDHAQTWNPARCARCHTDSGSDWGLAPGTDPTCHYVTVRDHTLPYVTISEGGAAPPAPGPGPAGRRCARVGHSGERYDFNFEMGHFNFANGQ
jgi:hypothetical protein